MTSELHRYEFRPEGAGWWAVCYLVENGTIAIFSSDGEFAHDFKLADNECVRRFVATTPIEYLAAKLEGPGLSERVLPAMVERARRELA